MSRNLPPRRGAFGAPSPERRPRDSRRGPAPTFSGADLALIWGWHAATAALANPARRIRRVMVTPALARQMAADGRLPAAPAPLVLEPDALERALPRGAVHQGIAVEAAALEPLELADVLDAPGLLLVLDQVTDPQNVGALFRSAAAFGVRAIVMQDRKSPPLTGALAKAAVGTIERVAEVRVTNIARALAEIADAGFRTVGLAGRASATLSALPPHASGTALVLGAEGEGLRPLVAQTCTALARIDMAAGMDSLNVSAAGAVALYEITRAQLNPPG